MLSWCWQQTRYGPPTGKRHAIVSSSSAQPLGRASHWFGGAILIATGIYAVVQTGRESAPAADLGSIGRSRLALTALAFSIDNLAIGFALGTRHVNLALAVILIGGVSITMSLVGLELGSRFGTQFGERGQLLGGVLLVGVG